MDRGFGLPQTAPLELEVCRVQLPLDLPVVKRCAGCRLVKPLADFNRRSTARDGRQWYCRECNRQWHRDNKDHHNSLIAARNKRVRREMTERMIAYLLEHPCTDCGETDPLVLEFDHLRDKRANVAVLLGYGSWRLIEAEIAKCEVVCANCHRRRTARRGRFLKYTHLYGEPEVDL